jgi:hypothetical protein
MVAIHREEGENARSSQQKQFLGEFGIDIDE